MLTRSNRTWVTVSLLVTGACISLLGVWALTRVKYVAILQSADGKTRSAVVERLHQLNISDRISGSSIMVPADDADKARIQLAAAGLLPQGTIRYISSSTPVQDASVTVQSITFFQHLFSSDIKLTLGVDSMVRQLLPNVAPPDTRVIVYLPMYPGATSTQPVAGITDMGSPLDGDLLVGAAYFRSASTQAQIKAWYTKQFQKAGYAIATAGSATDKGTTTSTYVGYTKHTIPGNPTIVPDISLGFQSAKHDGESIFKLKVSFIVAPPRPEDSYLPGDITKVVLTKGTMVKEMTDKTWITSVTRMINALQVSTPGIGTRMTSTNGAPTKLRIDFYEKDNSVIHVTYSILAATVTVGKSTVALNAGPSPALLKDLNAVFQ